jgi:hypothetical protein
VWGLQNLRTLVMPIGSKPRLGRKQGQVGRNRKLNDMFDHNTSELVKFLCGRLEIAHRKSIRFSRPVYL